MTALGQMELQRTLQEEWSDNAVSATIYLKPGELEGVKEYLSKNWSSMKSVSFLPHAAHGFSQAPLEEIEREDYESLQQRVSQSSLVPGAGESELLDEECLSGACPIR
jgi:hypothetical protein